MTPADAAATCGLAVLRPAQAARIRRPAATALAIALHECGHVLVHLVTRTRFVHVAAHADPVSRGHTLRWRDGAPHDTGATATLAARLACDLGGALAEWHVYGGINPAACASDLAVALARQLEGRPFVVGRGKATECATHVEAYALVDQLLKAEQDGRKAKAAAAPAPAVVPCPHAVGDPVRIDKGAGVVLEVGARSVLVQTGDGSMWRRAPGDCAKERE